MNRVWSQAVCPWWRFHKITAHFWDTQYPSISNECPVLRMCIQAVLWFFLGGLLSQKKTEKDWFSLEMMGENILLNHHWITILDLFWALLYSILHQPREGKPTTMGHKVGQNGPCDYLSHMLHGAAIFTHITGWFFWGKCGWIFFRHGRSEYVHWYTSTVGNPPTFHG